MKKQKFYSLKDIDKRNATYNVIFGERSNGKTYAVLKKALNNWVKDRRTFAYVRRWHEDVIGRRAQNVFSALISDGLVEKITGYQGVYYLSGKFYLCMYDEKSGKPIYNESDLLGYTFALSENEHNKSNSYPKVTLIMFDEFLTKSLYLQDEFVLFMNTISTIVRRKTDVKIYMLGNTVNRYCPYFAEMGLDHIKKMKQGDIDVYTYGDTDLKVAVEYCTSLKKNKENNYYFAFNNPKLNMITSGAWELDIYPHLPHKFKNKQIMFTFFIEFNDMLFQCEIIDADNEMFIFIHDKTTPLKDTDNDLIYSLDYNPKLNYNRNILKPQNQIQKKIAWFFKTDRVFYQDNKTGDTISNYLKLCKTSI